MYLGISNFTSHQGVIRNPVIADFVFVETTSFSEPGLINRKRTNLPKQLKQFFILHRATHVPVGDDQIQQIQLTQDLARMFNSRFGNTFPIPHSMTTGVQFARLRSLRDPNKKMSKSDPDPKSRICLTDKPDDIIKNIKKAVTDFTSEVTYNFDERPGVSNLISIHSFVTDKTVEEVCKEAETTINTGKYKMVVAEAVVSFLNPIQEKISYYLQEPQYLTEVLQQGREKANKISETTMEEVRLKLGLNFKLLGEQKATISA